MLNENHRTCRSSPAVAALGLVHHHNRGVQYLVVRCIGRLVEEGVVTSMRSKGDSQDGTLHESVSVPYWTILVQRCRSGRSQRML